MTVPADDAMITPRWTARTPPRCSRRWRSVPWTSSWKRPLAHHRLPRTRNAVGRKPRGRIFRERIAERLHGFQLVVTDEPALLTKRFERCTIAESEREHVVEEDHGHVA